ncbi:MAG TPA: polysaccharide biosynthesis/export family protein, partial [Silvibacterium sp.]|nr:polysaccharide biosynthesis/export family protein [Silvibacterium sp.]
MTRNNPRRGGLAGILILVFCLGFANAGWGQDAAPPSAPSTDTAQANPQDGSPSQPQGDAQPQNTQRPPTIAIGAGDQIDVEVFDTPELSGPVRVSQTGEINLPVLGNIHVAGLTPNQAARKIEAALKSHGILIEPHVTVAIAEYASQGATVTGEVRNPGLYPTLGSRRLLDMIALAGGVSPTAGRIATIIHRDDPHHPHNI